MFNKTSRPTYIEYESNSYYRNLEEAEKSKCRKLLIIKTLIITLTTGLTLAIFF